MERQLLLLIFTFLLNCKIENASMLWGSKTDDATVLVSIPYDSMTEDEKFLQEAAKFTDIQISSLLDTCRHKVVMKIRTLCSDMSEEELAKLGVNLLNCQSAVEGRKIFPCIEDMSLKQCTIDMDADMWNAYRIMSNRARAVCYAARNAQFRALTELTVNKQMQSAHSQIEALDSLKQSQDRLEEQTTEALLSLNKGKKVLLEKQEYLKDAQATAHKLVTTNLKELYHEKALIRSDHAQLAVMTEEIRNKLENAHNDLKQHAIERGENHRQVLQDVINTKDSNGRTPLHLAVEKCNLDKVKLLVEKGADVNAKDNNGITPLHLAVKKGWAVGDGYTPLHFAVYRKNLEMVEYLVEKGADVDATAVLNQTPLHLATSTFCTIAIGNIVKYLVEKGAKVNARTSDGYTSLYYAVSKNLEMVKCLVEKGADVNAQTDDSRETPLFEAVFHDDLEVVKYLVEKGANVNAKDKNGRTCVDFNIRTVIKEYLESHGAHRRNVRSIENGNRE